MDDIIHFYRNINLYQSEASKRLQQLKKRPKKQEDVAKHDRLKEMLNAVEVYDLKEVQLPYEPNDIVHKNYIEEMEVERGEALKININMEVTLRHITTRPFQLKPLLQKIVTKGDIDKGQKEWMEKVLYLLLSFVYTYEKRDHAKW